MTDAEFFLWAAQSDSVKIFLVELEARRQADGGVVPLYLASHGLSLENRNYLGVNLGLPDLTRQGNDTRDLSSIPTWGELEISYEPADKADAACSLTWSELLSQDYTFANRPVKILLGGEGFLYGDFRAVFSGFVMDRKAAAAKITFTVYDKCQYLESIKVPAQPLGLPQPPLGSGRKFKNLAARLAAGKLPKTNTNIPEGNRGKQLPLILGQVKNYHPVLIDDVTDKFALAGHVIHSVPVVRVNGAVKTPNYYTFTARDLSPVEKDGDGAALVNVTGPYTGAAYRRTWVVQIDSVDAGKEVGQATFRWSSDGGATWEAEGVLTSGVPILLGEGVSIQFLTVGGLDDFQLWDLFGWFLCSTLDYLFNVDENMLTGDVEGLVTAAAGAYIYKAADLIRELLTTYAGWDPGLDLDAVSFAAFNAAFPHTLGLKVDSPTEIRKIIDSLLGGLPAYYAVGLDGKFRLGEITNPAGTPAILLEDPRDALDIEEESKAEEIIYRVHLNYDRNWAAGNYSRATKVDQQWLKEEWREVEERDETIREDYPLAEVLGPVDTCLIAKTAAEAVAEKLLTLWSKERRPLTFKCKIQPFYQDLWNLTQVTSPLFGLAGGGLFLLPGMHLDFTANEAELNLWR